MESQNRSGLVRVDLSEPRYDQSTFLGRLRHFMDVTDVRTIFTSDKKLHDALELLDEYKKRGSPPVTEQEAENLWDAKKLRDAIVHPDTGKQIPLPVRFSFFVPSNVLITAGMLLPNPSIASVVFWQWINQSYNIALNHANRNASNEMSTETIAKTYASAVAISCGVAVGLGQAAKRVTGISPAARSILLKSVPFVAVSTAGVANVFMMRWNEAKEGISVRDAEGNDLGKSKQAGFNALTQVATSRVLTALPVLTFPQIIMSGLERTSFVKRYPVVVTPLNLAVIAGILWTALPVAIAAFPQKVAISPQKLEPQFHNLKDKNGKPIEVVYYNKGL
eukprot:TRINITY_DN3556_c0_g1_i1.p1 TRINITY_DN3556_c0_g1~~TRINITY_DN3556_c0_g1_i1.p1  ORF type:complete len:350 (-),score=42.55 TRINITY_DN3556_c0_g1_i1:9-1013(-)